MNPQLHLPAFQVELRFERNYTGIYRGATKLSVVLSRLLAPQLIEAYIPSAFLVVVSWLIFWLGAATERVALCVTILLALYNQSTGARQLLPPSTSVTALDRWMVACVLFVFAALAQTAQGMWTKRTPLGPACCTPFTRASWTWAGKRGMAVRALRGFAASGGVAANTEKQSGDDNTSFTRADKISRFAFPAAFVLFNIIYWSVLYG
ncbi:glycine receptor subunit alpha-2-like [Dermacentor andersoni]|uniref:glycine receptor subunit alpha-2-like n=1 Tax=Dermacentor andersoni TaxID=34620 RepID=UPI0024177CDB|nr:glycine receptor subunit alpha-2-like [Dermacentor andersoni]